MGTPTIQEISYAFVRTYYERMNNNPSKMSNLYSNTAELTHIGYQQKVDENSDVLATVKLTGKENISKFFVRNEAKVNDLKVKLDSCDFQTTGVNHKSIFIVVTGELFWTGTPTYRFCQSFILTPTSPSSDSYDITNDIIRFLGDNFQSIKAARQNSGHKKEENKSVEKSKESQPVKEKKVEEKPKEEPKEQEKIAPVSPKAAKEAPAPAPAPTSASEPSVPKPVTPVLKKETTHPVTNNVTKEAQTQASPEKEEIDATKKESATTKETVKENNKVVKEATEPKPVQENNSVSSRPSSSSTTPSQTPNQEQSSGPVKMTWASKLSQDTAVNTKAGFVKNEPIQTVKIEPNEEQEPSSSKKSSNGDRKFELAGRRENSSSTKTKKKPIFCTVNEDGFFPIYIRGTAGLKEDRLRNTLETNYGPVKKITMAENFSVVDFELQKSQTEAIETKKITIDGIEIYMERKTIKKSPTSTASSSSSSQGFTNVSKVYKKHAVKKKD